MWNGRTIACRMSEVEESKFTNQPLAWVLAKTLNTCISKPAVLPPKRLSDLADKEQDAGSSILVIIMMASPVFHQIPVNQQLVDLKKWFVFSYITSTMSMWLCSIVVIYSGHNMLVVLLLSSLTNYYVVVAIFFEVVDSLILFCADNRLNIIVNNI